MKNCFKLIFVLLGILICLSAAFAGNNKPTTFLGPTLRGSYTDTYNGNTAFSLAGEAGLKNFRIGGTIGWRLAENQRLKFTAEYLWQKITYAFFTGNTDEWVQQGAIGGLYQYHFCYTCWDPTIDVRAYYAYAPNKTLNNVTLFFTDAATGLLEATTYRRRIAGSNAGGIAPGVTFSPWCTTKLGFELNYDNVRYDRVRHPNNDAVGFGGTARLAQILSNNLLLDLSATVRQPFNNYKASLAWLNVPYYGMWTVSVDGAYTAGKHTLPNTWNVGITANYFVDQTCDAGCRRRAACEMTHACCDEPDNFLAWIADPAVYMPQVLAIPDEAASCSSPSPVNITAIPPIAVPSGDTVPFNAAAAFSPSTGLSYAITSITPALNPVNSITINPVTGIGSITHGGFQQTVTVTVAARNACGASASTSFEVEFLD